MAYPPPEPPSSLVVGQFDGIKNTVSEERLTQSELVSAVNVDIDNVGQLRRRRGMVQRDTRAHHSLVTIAGQTLIVREGVLGTLVPDMTFTPLQWVGPDPVSYVRVGPVVYFSSATASGKIDNGVVLPWGSFDGDQWISPVIRPTDTLGAISGKMLGRPPHATSLAAYKGRIYLANGRTLWVTELYQYDLVDKSRNFLYFEDDITMIADVGDGLYVGTTSELMFLAGVFSKGMERRTVLNAAVVPGSLAIVPYAKSMPQARSGPVPEGFGPMFLTSAGVMVGLDGGQAYNLTQDHVVFPGAVRAAAMYREDQGSNTFVAVVDSAGGPSANARIGDYVDAEIVRASQRG